MFFDNARKLIVTCREKTVCQCNKEEKNGVRPLLFTFGWIVLSRMGFDPLNATPNAKYFTEANI